MNKRKRIRKGIKTFLVLVFLTIIAIYFIAGKTYYNSYDYKLHKIGYDEKEIEEIKKLKVEEIKILFQKKYNKLYVKFMKQKNFVFNNLEDYIIYYNESNNKSLSYVISVVNVNANHKHYDKNVVKKTNIKDKELMIVNKYNSLDKSYIPSDLVTIKNSYCYGDNKKIKKEVYEAFLNMWNAAKKENLNLIITSAYRDYDYQQKLWDSYATNNGKKWADSVAARAGFSEHQTGYALDIVTYRSKMNDFEDTNEFKWLSNNAHKYGFILRYPKGKEYLTGYSYESWHYRYVGTKPAKYIYENNITFEEYYSLFLK